MTKIYIGLDVSQTETHICALDSEGKKLWQGKCVTSPEAIAQTVRAKIPNATSIGMESGPLSCWLWHGLQQLGLPIVCLHARHVARYLELNLNKTDKNDARGIAEYLQSPKPKIVNVKSMDSYRVRTLLGARAQLVGMRTDLKNQMRGILKIYGLVVSHREEKGFAAKLCGAMKHSAELRKMIAPLQAVLKSVHEQVLRLDNLITQHVKGDGICCHLKTIPGVGPITAAAYVSTVDDPRRFKNSRLVGAYFGLTSRRYQSGETDRAGHISKHGDRLVRSYLYEAANVLLTKTTKWCSLKAWGMRLAKRRGMMRARVAVARKLAVIMHQMWLTGEEFRWSNTASAA